MFKFKIIIAIIFLVEFGSIHASVSNTTKGGVSQKIKLLTDSTRTLNILQVEEKQYESKSISPQFIVPSIDYDYWFIIKCKNTNDYNVDQLIGFDIACFETVDLYFKDSLEWIHRRNGLTVPIEDREVFSRLPEFIVSFKPYEEKTVYLHLHSKYLVPTSLVNKPMASVIKTDTKSLFAYWFYIGAAISILLYNLLLFLQLRDKVYLYYILYVLCLLIWISLDSGLFLYFSSSIKLYYLLSIGAPVMGFFLTLFTREILQIKTVNKWMDKVLIVISVSYLIIAVLIGINVYFYQFLGLIAMPFTLFLLYVGVYGIFKKIPLSSFYVIASSFYILGVFSYAGLTLGAIPYNPLTRYGFVLGSFFELIVFSLALGYRIKLLQTEKLSFQNKIIENERTMSRNLEVKVKERTQELRATSEQLANANIQLQDSNNAKDKLFSIISHDLRGPIGSIMGLLEFFKDNYDSYDTNKRKNIINTIFESTSRTFQMLENLLFWSRNQTNGLIFEPVEFDIVQIILEISQILKSQSEAKEITVKIPDSKINVFADSEMIKTVIRNLISNAIKFSKMGGEISVTVSPKTNSKNEIVVAVMDYGIGINLEKQKNIFTLGSDNSSEGTCNEKGTGLGLVLCKELLEKHNGRIWVNSELDKGSTFYFAIPL